MTLKNSKHKELSIQETLPADSHLLTNTVLLTGKPLFSCWVNIGTMQLENTIYNGIEEKNNNQAKQYIFELIFKYVSGYNS